MIVLCTDFGLTGPYLGQVKAVLARAAPAIPVVDLFADLPAFEPRLAAYLLAAYGGWFEAGDVILAVVDPGVGGPRSALAVEADGGGSSDRTTACSNSCCAAPGAPAAWRSPGSRPPCRRPSTAATCSRRSPRVWRWAKRRPDRNSRRPAIRSGPTIWP